MHEADGLGRDAEQIRGKHLEKIFVVAHVGEAGLVGNLGDFRLAQRAVQESRDLADTAFEIPLQVFVMHEQNIVVLSATLPPAFHMVGPGHPPHVVAAIPCQQVAARGHQRPAQFVDEVDATGEAAHRMARHINVSRDITMGNQLRGHMGLDDAIAPRAHQRCVFHGDAGSRAGLDPGAQGVHVAIAGVGKIALAPVQDLEHDLLHPGRAAFHLGGDEDIRRFGLVVFGARIGLLAAHHERAGHLSVAHDRHFLQTHDLGDGFKYRADVARMPLQSLHKAAALGQWAGEVAIAPRLQFAPNHQAHHMGKPCRQ